MIYEDLLIWQYKGKPKAAQTIKAITLFCNEYLDLIRQFPILLDVKTAKGYHLDVIGRIVGISRFVSGYTYRKFFGFTISENALGFSVNKKGGGRWYRFGNPLSDTTRLDDDEFRWLIYSKIARNNARGNLHYLHETCRLLVGRDVEITDNYNMTVSIRIPTTDLNDFKVWALLNMDVLPRPTGVQYLLSTYNK